MSRRFTWTLSALLALSLGSCSDDSQAPPTPDKGGAMDKGAGVDGGAGDKGTGDQSKSGDQGAALDKGQTQKDAPAGGCSAAFAGCSSFTDGTTISFTNFVYTPKCLRVKVGQAVSFNGSFSAHPLDHACGPATVITATSTGSSKSFTFTKAGIYGYYCTAHGTATGTGMAGAIEVVP